MNWVRGGSWASISSIQPSSVAVWVGEKAVRCSLAWEEEGMGVATADPRSKSRDCSSSSCVRQGSRAGGLSEAVVGGSGACPLLDRRGSRAGQEQGAQQHALLLRWRWQCHQATRQRSSAM